MKKRVLDFHSGEEVIAEIERLRGSQYQKLKNWNLTQVCDHLQKTMAGGMDGFGFRLPWILRATFMKWGFGYYLKKRRLSSGAPTFSVLKPEPSEEQDDDALIDECIATVHRAENFDGSLEDYPLLDNLTPDTWRQFMWIHAAHHLGYLVTE